MTRFKDTVADDYAHVLEFQGLPTRSRPPARCREAINTYTGGTDEKRG
jgi:hypothetical protein